MWPIITDADLERWIGEDAPYGDLTTRSLGLDHRLAGIVFRAGAPMTASSTEEAVRILQRLGCSVTAAVASGTALARGAVLVEAAGPAGAVHTAWKIAQTLMEYASGIASCAAGMVAAARSARPDIVVACTRKTFPGTKAVAIKAIIAGKATPHRLGLSDSLLVFPEHRAFFGDAGMADSIRLAKSACPEKKVVVEVCSPDDAQSAAEAGADVIQLEKFTADEVRATAGRLARYPLLIAAAGGINLGNAAAYAAAGAHILVTSAPYTAPPLDVKVTISRGD